MQRLCPTAKHITHNRVGLRQPGQCDVATVPVSLQAATARLNARRLQIPESRGVKVHRAALPRTTAKESNNRRQQSRQGFKCGKGPTKCRHLPESICFAEVLCPTYPPAGTTPYVAPSSACCCSLKLLRRGSNPRSWTQASGNGNRPSYPSRCRGGHDSADHHPHT